MNTLDLFMQTFLSRRDDFAVQRPDGGYVRVRRPVLAREIHAHLSGKQTMGSYVIDEQGKCSYAVFDADNEDGLFDLCKLHTQLASDGIVSYSEESRRGGHLWVFLSTPVRAAQVRAWLLPYCWPDMEFYPKQDEGKGYGSLIRVPLGVHLRSGKRYPFVEWTPAGIVPVAHSLKELLAWLETIQRVEVWHLLDTPTNEHTRPTPPNKKTSFSNPSQSISTCAYKSIRAWCAHQDAYALISRYVTLNHQDVGCCPFGWHHANGRDTHASFKVYTPGVPGGYCWYCHVWQQGGSIFDFLRYAYNLDARSLWQQIQAGEVHV